MAANGPTSFLTCRSQASAMNKRSRALLTSLREQAATRCRSRQRQTKSACSKSASGAGSFARPLSYAEPSSSPNKPSVGPAQLLAEEREQRRVERAMERDAIKARRVVADARQRLGLLGRA